MQSDDDQKKARARRALKKSDGWREREESSNARRTLGADDDVRSVRC